MMRRTERYFLEPGRNRLQIPFGARALAVVNSNGSLYLWVEYEMSGYADEGEDADEPVTETVGVFVVEGREEFELPEHNGEESTYLGTVQTRGLWYHVYREPDGLDWGRAG